MFPSRRDTAKTLVALERKACTWHTGITESKVLPIISASFKSPTRQPCWMKARVASSQETITKLGSYCQRGGKSQNRSALSTTACALCLSLGGSTTHSKIPWQTSKTLAQAVRFGADYSLILSHSSRSLAWTSGKFTFSADHHCGQVLEWASGCCPRIAPLS